MPCIIDIEGVTTCTPECCPMPEVGIKLRGTVNLHLHSTVLCFSWVRHSTLNVSP